MQIENVWQTINCDMDDEHHIIVERLQDLVDNKCENVRINLKDFSEKDVIRVNKLLDALEEVKNEKPGIMLDIPFPRRKCRIHMNQDLHVSKNEIIEIHDLEDKNADIAIDMKMFLKSAQLGERYYVGDGEGVLELCELTKNNSAKFRVAHDFVICCNKAITVRQLSYQIISDWYVEILRQWIECHNIESIAFSFVENMEDIHCIDKLNALIQERHIKLYAKIENTRGVNNVSSILNAFQGCIIARGDLALNSSISNFLMSQEAIVNETKKRHKDLFYATDILDSLAYQNFPNRGELVDYVTIKSNNPSGIILKSSAYFKKRFSIVNSFINLCEERI